MKKGFKKFAVILAAVSLTGCQNDIEPAPDITSGIEDGTKSDIPEAIETTDISIGENFFIPKLLMETDKPFVRAEDHYRVEKQDVDVNILNKCGMGGIAVDGKYYYSEETMGKLFYSMYGEGKKTVENASLAVYDSNEGEYSVLFSEAPKDDEHGLNFWIFGLYDSFLYYYRNEFWTFGENGDLQLCRLNLKDKTSEKLFDFADEYSRMPDFPIRYEGFLYFYEVHDIDWKKSEGKWTIYCCDMNTGETSIFRDDAESPILYKNGIVYYHDDGFYYHGDSANITGKGLFYEGDELLFYPNPEGEKQVSGINIKGDTVIYTYDVYDTYQPHYAVGSVMGIFDEDFIRTDLVATPHEIAWYINAEGCEMSEAGLISVGGAPKPLIYDTEIDGFAMIPIDDYSDYISYATEDSICFFAYDIDDDDYRKYTSAALYTVKRR